jgi:hypothetical protein
MNEKPTTFELAQLAAQAAPPNTRPKEAVRRAMALWQEAETELAEHEKRAEYLRCVFGAGDDKESPLFTDTPEEWSARIQGYPGDEADVTKALWDKQYPTEQVAKLLFKDKTFTREARRKLLRGLIRVSILNDLPGPRIPNTRTIEYLKAGVFLPPQPGFPIHPKNVELAREHYRGRGPMEVPANEVYFVKQVEGVMAQPTLNAHQVRWAVEARQRQLALAKSREIPQSRKSQQQERDKDDGIQVKRPYRQ